MTKYEEVAIKAFAYIESGCSAEEAWEKASCEMWGQGATSQTKSCPKGAFLGLFSKDEKAGNAQYAQIGLAILKANPNKHYKPSELWALVLAELGKNTSKTYNQQMHVVLALWGNPKARLVLQR